MLDMGMASLYEDMPTHMQTIMMKPRKPSPSVNEMKRSMKLDLNGQDDQPMVKKMKSASMPMMLSSPDLQLLKLASPDLEKFLMTNFGVSTTTPTPTQYFFPKNVSDEQKGFAEGFVSALTELRQKGTDGGPLQMEVPAMSIPVVGATTTIATTGSMYEAKSALKSFAPSTTVLKVVEQSSNGEPRVLTVLNPVPMNVRSSNQEVPALFIPTSSASPAMSRSPMLPQTLQSPPPHLATMVNPNLLQIKEEAEMVPSPATTSDSYLSRGSLCGTPPLSPIDMEMQEKVKLERKRARNRIAAMKCRQRKIERIQELEGRVNALKHNNQDLAVTADKLRQEVAALKEQILQHQNAGCQIVQLGALH